MDVKSFLAYLVRRLEDSEALYHSAANAVEMQNTYDPSGLGRLYYFTESGRDSLLRRTPRVVRRVPRSTLQSQNEGHLFFFSGLSCSRKDFLQGSENLELLIRPSPYYFMFYLNKN